MSDDLNAGDYVELVGFESAYSPPNPRGFIEPNPKDPEYPWVIDFDPDVHFKAEVDDVGFDPPRPYGGFTSDCFKKLEILSRLPSGLCSECGEIGVKASDDYLCRECRISTM